MNRIIRMLVAITALALLASACGGSGDETAEAPPTTEASATNDAESTETSATPTTSAAPTTTTESPTTTTTSESPTTSTTVPTAEQVTGSDCVLETTDGAIAGIDDGTDIVLAVATLVDRCGLPDLDSGWGWSCAMGGPDWDGPQEPERAIAWGGLVLTFWRQPDNTWAPQEFSESPTYSDSGVLSSWRFSGWEDDRVALDIQEAGISLGTPLSEIAEAVGVAVAPHDLNTGGSWDDYVDYVLGVFGIMDFVGGDGVVYSGFPPTTPANFEEALASTSLSMIGELQFCD